MLAEVEFTHGPNRDLHCHLRAQTNTLFFLEETDGPLGSS